MTGCPKLLCRAAVILLGLTAAAEVRSAEIVVPAQPGALSDAMREARAGDTVRLLPGDHQGPIKVGVSITLQGSGSTHIAGNGSGSVITVDAPDVTISGLRISGSGSSAEHRDSGILLTKKARRAVIGPHEVVQLVS